MPRSSHRSELSWTEVAAGMMIVKGAMLPHSGGRASLERTLLKRAQMTWLPQAPGMGLLLATSCSDAGELTPPSWWSKTDTNHGAGGEGAVAEQPSVSWRCYNGHDRLGRSLWRKTGALLAMLHARYPRRRFYLKIDSDAFVLPCSLLRFLSALHAGIPHGQPIYFGSNRIASTMTVSTRLFSAPAWQALERRTMRETPRGLRNATGKKRSTARGRGRAVRSCVGAERWRTRAVRTALMHASLHQSRSLREQQGLLRARGCLRV